MTQVVGFVKEIKVRTGANAQGKPWKSFTLVMEGKAGEQLGFFSTGFEAPKASQGDYVQFEHTTNAKGYHDVVKGSLKVASKPPARGASAPAAAGEGPAANTLTNSERNNQIVFQSARNAAVELVATLGTLKALPVSQASTKAADAKRFDEILAIVDKLTVRFYNDTLTLRTLETVQDTGADESPAEEQVEETAEGDEFADDASAGDDPGFE